MAVMGPELAAVDLRDEGEPVGHGGVGPDVGDVRAGQQSVVGQLGDGGVGGGVDWAPRRCRRSPAAEATTTARDPAEGGRSCDPVTGHPNSNPPYAGGVTLTRRPTGAQPGHASTSLDAWRRRLRQGPASRRTSFRELTQITKQRKQLERREATLVRRARAKGYVWEEIATALGVTKQAVHREVRGRARPSPLNRRRPPAGGQAMAASRSAAGRSGSRSTATAAVRSPGLRPQLPRHGRPVPPVARHTSPVRRSRLASCSP